MAHTPHPHPSRRRRPIAAAAAAAAVLGAATPGAPAAAQTQIVVTGRSLAAPGVTGFGDAPPATAPMSVGVVDAAALADAGIASLDGLTRLDAGLSDAYNAEGYWSFLAARGFVLDNRANYRRDGLPVNAETFLPLANKDRVEVLKGTSGVQAGTSAPGGLVNLVVKRPTGDFAEAALEAREQATLAARVDVSRRFGEGGRFGLRLNAEAAALRPPTRSADGRRHVLAVAADWLPGADTRVEVEAEHGRRSQPSVTGFGLAGDRLPDPRSVDPRANLNDQPWVRPVVLRGDTASVRVVHRLSGADWRLSAHAMTQRLASDDRTAFAFGCSAEERYDRWCSDGTVDLYDFRSEGERRRSDALQLAATGSVATGALRHRLSLTLLGTRAQDRFGPQAYNYAGTVDAYGPAGPARVPAAPEALDANTNRDERSREIGLTDVVALAPGVEAWLGLRHSRIDRRSVRTDGSRATAPPSQSFTTPWAALAWQPAPGWTVYASSGQGVEAEVVPGRSVYTNAGQFLPALKSRQRELGLKHASGPVAAELTAFDIRRPRTADVCAPDGAPPCTRAVDGAARHRGVEASLAARVGAWTLSGSAMALRARREGAADPAVDGSVPTNVPARSVKAQVAYAVAAGPGLPSGLQWQAALVHEGPRRVLADGSLALPGWTRLDAALRWTTGGAGGSQAWVWRLGVDNLTDRRAWRESPEQFGHAWLFPLAPRAWRASATASF